MLTEVPYFIEEREGSFSATDQGQSCECDVVLMHNHYSEAPTACTQSGNSFYSLDSRPLLFLLFGLHSHSCLNESRKPFTFMYHFEHKQRNEDGIKAIACLYNNSSTFPALYVAHGSTC